MIGSLVVIDEVLNDFWAMTFSGVMDAGGLQTWLAMPAVSGYYG